MMDQRTSGAMRRIATRIQHAAWLGYLIGTVDAFTIVGALGSTHRARLVFGGAAIAAIVAAAIGLIRASATEL